MRPAVVLMIACGITPWHTAAQSWLGPNQARFLGVQGWTGTFSISTKSSGPGYALTYPGTYTRDFSVSGSFRAEPYDPEIAGWMGTVTGTVTVTETGTATFGKCIITVKSQGSVPIGPQKYTNEPSRSYVTFDLESDTYSFWFVAGQPDVETVITYDCPSGTTTQSGRFPVTWSPFGRSDHLTFPATGFKLAGSKKIPSCTLGANFVGPDYFSGSALPDCDATWSIEPTGIDQSQPKTNEVDDPCLRGGWSIIGCQNQSLGEDLPVVGTGFSLHYESERMPGRAGGGAAWTARAFELGGWSLSAHHSFDPSGKILYLGSGARRSGNRVKIYPANMPGVPKDSTLVVSENSDEVYLFDSTGRHLQTYEGLTGILLLSFGYDAHGRLASITDADGNVTTAERDGAGNPVAIQAPYGQRTVMAVDGEGNLAQVINPAGEAVGLAYAKGGLLNSLTDAREGVHRFSYDSSGRLARDENPAGGFITLSRAEQASGYSVTTSTAQERTSIYQVENHTAPDYQKKVDILPSGLRAEFMKDPQGAQTATYPDGTTIMQMPGQDPRWGMATAVSSVSFTTPGGISSTAAMTREATLTDPVNRLGVSTQTDMTNINGRTYTSTYLGASRTLTAASPVGRKMILTLNDKARPITLTSGDLLPVNYKYDEHGRLTTVTRGTEGSARTVKLAYGTDGRLQSFTDPLGRSATFQHDRAARLTQSSWQGRSVGFSYDAGGNLVGITPTDRSEHKFSYTPANLQSAYLPPAIGAGDTRTVYSYSADRDVTRVERPGGQSLDFSYDAAGRMKSATAPNGQIKYEYDGVSGRLASVATPDGSVLTYTYDGLLPVRSTWTGPVAGEVSRSYDINLRTASVDTAGGRVVTYEYDDDNLVTKAENLIIERYPQTGLLKGTSLGGLMDAYTYNGFGECTEYSASYNGAAFYAVQYTRDNLGRITEKTETLAGVSDNYAYSYDDAGQLAEVRRNDVAASAFTYDSNSNRVHFSGPDGAYDASYDAQDRMTQYGEASYSYGASGELQSKSTATESTSYRYDALGNLMAATLPGGKKIEYLVDAHNRRIGKKIDGALVQGFLYQDRLKPIVELDGQNNVVSRFIYALHSNVPEYMVKGGISYRLITDHLGSVRSVLDTSTGQTVQQLNYDVFGNVTSDTNPSFQPFGFAGGLYDPDTKLVRFGERDYDPGTGRWTAKDPLLFAGKQANLYAYVGNDPVNKTDPLGMASLGFSFYAGIGGGVKFTYAKGLGLSLEVEIGVGMPGVEMAFEPGAEPMQSDDPLWDSQATLFGEVSRAAGPIAFTAKVESKELECSPGKFGGEFGSPEFSAELCYGPACIGGDGVTAKIDPTKSVKRHFQGTKGVEYSTKAGVRIALPIFGK